jgi:phage terminase large subunit-like protein
MEWSTACPDWERRIVARESLIVSPPLFPSVAEQAWAVCSEFCLTDVMGQPLLGEASLPWLRDFVMAIFGAENPETGRRLINEFMLMVQEERQEYGCCSDHAVRPSNELASVGRAADS